MLFFTSLDEIEKASTYSALEILSMLVPPGAPMGSPHVMA
jgi:hypothetical protein